MYRGTVFERVERGSTLLDERYPGGDGTRPWWNMVDPERVNIDHSRDCILGQLFGDYGRGEHELFGGLSSDEMKRHGFWPDYGRDGSEWDEDTAALNAQWVMEIHDRRNR